MKIQNIFIWKVENILSGKLNSGNSFVPTLVNSFHHQGSQYPGFCCQRLVFSVIKVNIILQLPSFDQQDDFDFYPCCCMNHNLLFFFFYY